MSRGLGIEALRQFLFTDLLQGICLHSTLKVRNYLRSSAFYLLVWVPFCLFFFTRSALQQWRWGEAGYWTNPDRWSALLVCWMIQALALVTPAMLKCARAFPIERTKRLKRVALHLFASLAIAALASTVTALATGFRFETQLGAKDNLRRILTDLPPGFHQVFLAWWIVIGAWYTVDCYRKYREREQRALQLKVQSTQLKSQLLQAQVRVLRLELQPQFLFRTMDAIRSLVRQHEGNEADAMLDGLAAFLRCVLEDEDAPEVTVRREIEYVQRYLAVEQLRLGDKIRVKVTAEPETLDAAVACMSLQPIVEKAIRSGVWKSSEATVIKITARRLDKTLSLEVEHNDTSLASSCAPSDVNDHLANTSSRLSQVYGKASRLKVEKGEDGCTRVKILIPYHQMNDVDEPGLGQPE